MKIKTKIEVLDSVMSRLGAALKLLVSAPLQTLKITEDPRELFFMGVISTNILPY